METDVHYDEYLDVDARSLRAFAARHGLDVVDDERLDGRLVLRGIFEGVPFSIRKADRRATADDGEDIVTQLTATTLHPLPGGVVAYRPGFRLRLPGPRRVADGPYPLSLVGFAHHDPLGDPELDRRLVVNAGDVGVARALLTAPEVKAAILDALDRTGHVRIQRSEVAIETRDRGTGRFGLHRPYASADELEVPARAVTALALALSGAAGRLSRREGTYR